MGGSSWSHEEERIFWTVIVPLSKEDHNVIAGININNPQTWMWLAEEMTRRMAALLVGPGPPRRTYSHLSLSEHFYQNVKNEKYSPYARKYAQAYINEYVRRFGSRPCDNKNSGRGHQASAEARVQNRQRNKDNKARKRAEDARAESQRGSSAGSDRHTSSPLLTEAGGSGQGSHKNPINLSQEGEDDEDGGYRGSGNSSQKNPHQRRSNGSSGSWSGGPDRRANTGSASYGGRPSEGQHRRLPDDRPPRDSLNSHFAPTPYDNRERMPGPYGGHPSDFPHHHGPGAPYYNSFGGYVPPPPHHHSYGPGPLPAHHTGYYDNGFGHRDGHGHGYGGHDSYDNRSAPGPSNYNRGGQRRDEYAPILSDGRGESLRDHMSQSEFGASNFGRSSHHDTWNSSYEPRHAPSQNWPPSYERERDLQREYDEYERRRGGRDEFFNSSRGHGSAPRRNPDDVHYRNRHNVEHEHVDPRHLTLGNRIDNGEGSSRQHAARYENPVNSVEDPIHISSEEPSPANQPDEATQEAARTMEALSKTQTPVNAEKTPEKPTAQEDTDMNDPGEIDHENLPKADDQPDKKGKDKAATPRTSNESGMFVASQPEAEPEPESPIPSSSRANADPVSHRPEGSRPPVQNTTASSQQQRTPLPNRRPSPMIIDSGDDGHPHLRPHPLTQGPNAMRFLVQDEYGRDTPLFPSARQQEYAHKPSTSVYNHARPVNYGYFPDQQTTYGQLSSRQHTHGPAESSRQAAYQNYPDMSRSGPSSSQNHRAPDVSPWPRQHHDPRPVEFPNLAAAQNYREDDFYHPSGSRLSSARGVLTPEPEPLRNRADRLPGPPRQDLNRAHEASLPSIRRIATPAVPSIEQPATEADDCVDVPTENTRPATPQAESEADDAEDENDGDDEDEELPSRGIKRKRHPSPESDDL